MSASKVEGGGEMFCGMLAGIVEEGVGPLEKRQDYVLTWYVTYTKRWRGSHGSEEPAIRVNAIVSEALATSFGDETLSETPETQPYQMIFLNDKMIIALIDSHLLTTSLSCSVAHWRSRRNAMLKEHHTTRS